MQYIVIYWIYYFTLNLGLLYSNSYVSVSRRNDAIPLFLLLFWRNNSLSKLSYNSIIWRNCPTKLSLLEMMIFLYKNPIVHDSVPLQIQTAFMASSVFPLMHAMHNLNPRRSSGLMCIPQKSCDSQFFPFAITFNRTISQSLLIIHIFFSENEPSLAKLMIEYCKNFFNPLFSEINLYRSFSLHTKIFSEPVQCHKTKSHKNYFFYRFFAAKI